MDLNTKIPAGQSSDLLAIFDRYLYPFVDMLFKYRPLRQLAAVMNQFHRNNVRHGGSVVDGQDRGIQRVAPCDDFFAGSQYGQLLRRCTYASNLHRIVERNPRSYVPIPISKFHPCSSTCLYIFIKNTA
ncbi:hypothetical protein D3C73_1322880 [compost metagenome]